MKNYVGLDVSLTNCAVCVLQEDGTRVFEGECSTDPDEIIKTIYLNADCVERIVHESGPLSIWLSRELDRRGVPVVCIDARAAHKALSARMNKSDRSDAEALAQLARTGWYREVHIKSENSDRLRLLLSARERLVRIRMDIEGQARGILKTFGIRLGVVRKGRSRRDFRDQLSEIVSGDPILEVVFASMIKVHETVCHKTTDLDAEIQKYAKDCPLARRLTSVPGVGPIVALSFIATIDDATRFRRAVDVGAYLGLTPRRYQSGETDWSGRISKRGDQSMRKLLYEAANILIQRVAKFSPLKGWAMRLVQRKGLKKATVATARKMAVILTRLWRDGTEFAWTKEALPA
ncbi:Transposase IS116/IS110/IS902 family protein [Ruegeria denitrificans]|uniref:Transposase IS116/IS110/IS902 family protein n=1 Tax=Ruegeria denitrificans TaxID=1715692 RepID=A0A0P1IS71_9RHOB|nr:IS110 family transposase [Ruegeria denitrificans]CUK01918.1 Transposase IS116/IS110/IS902 family protein [Ruegeria denitrificans]